MLSSFCSFLGGWFIFLTIFVFLLGDAEVVSDQSTPLVGKWLIMDYKQFKECENNEVVVGMCRSGRKRGCTHVKTRDTPHKMLCRKPDATIFDMPNEKTNTNVAFDQSKDAKVCDGNSYLGGFCVSGLRSDCSGKFNQMKCQSGYSIDKINTKDICADYGQEIQCPGDEEDGIWVAIGFCSSAGGPLCSDLKCANEVKPPRNAHGLRCAKLKKKETGSTSTDVFIGGENGSISNLIIQNSSPSNITSKLDTNEKEALSGEDQTSTSEDEDLAKLVADLMKEKKNSSANSAKVSWGFVFVLTFGLLMWAFNF